MKYATTIGVVILFFLSCKQSQKRNSNSFSSVKIETIGRGFITQYQSDRI